MKNKKNVLESFLDVPTHTDGDTSEQSWNHINELPSEILDWFDQESNHLFAVITLQGKLLYVSKNLPSMFGYYFQELKKVKLKTLIHPNDYPYVSTKIPDHIGASKKLTYRLLHKEGHYVWVESYISRMMIDCKEYIVSYTTDISKLKETEDHLAHSEKMTVAGQLAAGIAHEIRNPLTSLKGFLQLMEAGVDIKGQYYKIMKEEIEKIESITSELLYISKPYSHHRTNVSLNELLTDVCTLMQSQARLNEVEIKVLLGKQNMFIECDKSQMKQAFINIIKNAIEVMEQGGEIEVRAHVENSNVVIDIQDEGPGIPDQLLDKIQEPFFTTKENGTGLGLMITNQIIENHSGDIQIISKELEKGTLFRVTLPRT
ncbi:PAS domain-containing sensor histidine kinase [Salinibacillus xinjiangensis]|uniref:histidine kinase n=1 Tax=Salinibacillus xinjiangensis TaxID=1229268 RepID=A0A6G1X319_9BACI|nr:PAS domain-containing sensor histidine kinase [Salinibacillus xinjiangensis]MRG85296.1 PAS domain S-box protein [Salinibacillus xinjiangensis]